MNLRARFLELQTLLAEHEEIWRPAPFHSVSPRWREHRPALATALEALDDEAVKRFGLDPQACADWLAAYLPALGMVNKLSEVPALPARSLPASRAREDDGMPGRKRAQVEAFVRHIPATVTPALEWCAGKGHLGRKVALTDQVPVVSLELNPALCADAKSLATRKGVDQEILCADALTASGHEHVRGRTVFALHACGELHRSLVRNAHTDGAEAYRISPCCYHLGSEDPYQPLSSDASLMLDASALRLAVTELVTAPERDRTHLARDQAWKLGFIALRTEVEGETRRPFRPVPAAWFDGSFDDFCRRLAIREHVRLPANPAWADWEHVGWKRRDEVLRLELVRHAFRRGLELWLVLDLALGLGERGFDVVLGRFCERSLTPRNLLVIGQRRPDSRTAA